MAIKGWTLIVILLLALAIGAAVAHASKAEKKTTKKVDGDVDIGDYAVDFKPSGPTAGAWNPYYEKTESRMDQLIRESSEAIRRDEELN